MFGRDALTNLKHLISPKLRYMGMEELILDLEIMSNIYQAQIHNLKLAEATCIIEDQKPVPNPKINTGGPCPSQRSHQQVIHAYV